MKETYLHICNKARQSLYQFIKLHEIQIKKYNYACFFDEITRTNKILILQHHFDDNAVSGLFIKNDEGVTISYEKTHPVVRQNFTKCHELGHFELKHSGDYFTENNKSNEKLDDIKEIEANIYSAFILMPDIVLLQKIGYESKPFNLILKELEVSKEASHNRLMDFLKYKHNLNHKLALNIVMNYRNNINQPLLKYLKLKEKEILTEYQQVTYDPIEKFSLLIKEHDFINSYMLKELNNNEFKQQIKNKFNHIGAWGYYDKGKSISYAFDKNKLTDKQALQKAKTILILKH